MVDVCKPTRNQRQRVFVIFTALAVDTVNMSEALSNVSGVHTANHTQTDMIAAEALTARSGKWRHRHRMLPVVPVKTLEASKS